MVRSRSGKKILIFYVRTGDQFFKRIFAQGIVLQKNKKEKKEKEKDGLEYLIIRKIWHEISFRLFWIQVDQNHSIQSEI